MGAELEIAIMDLDLGEAVVVNGVVARRNAPNDRGEGGGIGIMLLDPPEAWAALITRQSQRAEPTETGPTAHLRVLVVGDDDRRRGALALYVNSGWDVRFASDLEGAKEALAAVKLNAIIAEYEFDDELWVRVLEDARRIQPDARRLVRCALGGAERDASKSNGLVHRFLDISAGMDALLDAFTADLGGE
jgi:hypothetical protein